MFINLLIRVNQKRDSHGAIRTLKFPRKIFQKIPVYYPFFFDKIFCQNEDCRVRSTTTGVVSHIINCRVLTGTGPQGIVSSSTRFKFSKFKYN